MNTSELKKLVGERAVEIMSSITFQPRTIGDFQSRIGFILENDELISREVRKDIENMPRDQEFVKWFREINKAAR